MDNCYKHEPVICRIDFIGDRCRCRAEYGGRNVGDQGRNEDRRLTLSHACRTREILAMPHEEGHGASTKGKKQGLYDGFPED